MGFKARRKVVGIHVTRDPDDVAIERCCNCRRKTAFWYTPKDVACCQTCASELCHDDVPSKDEWWPVPKNLCGKPMSHWEAVARRDIIELLIRAAYTGDNRSASGGIVRARLIELAKMEDPVLLEEVLDERFRCIEGFSRIMKDILG